MMIEIINFVNTSKNKPVNIMNINIFESNLKLKMSLIENIIYLKQKNKKKTNQIEFSFDNDDFVDRR
jgi:hypothetical protein